MIHSSWRKYDALFYNWAKSQDNTWIRFLMHKIWESSMRKNIFLHERCIISRCCMWRRERHFVCEYFESEFVYYGVFTHWFLLLHCCWFFVFDVDFSVNVLNVRNGVWRKIWKLLENMLYSVIPNQGNERSDLTNVRQWCSVQCSRVINYYHS